MRYRFAIGDEAGDTGRKYDRGSSIHFVAGLTLLNDATLLRQYVQDFHRKLHLQEAGELSFHHSPDRNRLAFLSGLEPFDFVVRAVVVDKRTLPPNFGPNKLGFYVHFFGRLFGWVAPRELQRARIVLDEFGSPAVTIPTLTRRLRRQLAGSEFSSWFKGPLQAKRSHREPILQLADMLTGAVFRLVEKGDVRFYRLFRSKASIWRPEENENPPG